MNIEIYQIILKWFLLFGTIAVQLPSLSQSSRAPVISGNIYSDTSMWVTLSYWGETPYNDSLYLKKGHNKVYFKGVSLSNTDYQYYSLDFDYRQIWLHLSNEVVTINLDLRKPTSMHLFDVDNSIWDSPATTEFYHLCAGYYKEIRSHYKYLKAKLDSLNKIAPDSKEILNTRNDLKKIKEKEEKYLIYQTLTSNYACNASQSFTWLTNNKYNLSSYVWVADSLMKKFPNSEHILKNSAISQVKMESLNRNKPLYHAPNFQLQTIRNEKIELLDYRDNFILIDFWASWCTPCIKEMPNTIEIQKKYADKGLKVITISIDKDREAWLKAIKEHNMQNLINLHDEKGEAAKAYNVSYVPLTVLINPKGEIIGSNLHGEELESKLSVIYKDE